jgi:hypothetical protein
MTGCVAVVSLALGSPRPTWAEERSAARASQVSRFGLHETLQRLAACAPSHGLAVLVRWTPADATRVRPVSRTLGARSAGEAVLVFESRAQGGTPVLMRGEAAPDLPLSLHLHQRADGQVEVLLPSPPDVYAQALPAEVARELTSLPALVADALA